MLNTESSEIIGVRAGPARNLARHLLKTARVKEPPVYINELIPTLKQDYELLVKSWLLSDHVSGFLIQEDDLSAIAYNKTHHVHRQRFTVAHEIGHLLLGHNKYTNHSDVSETDEKEAQIFASELLMPLAFLKIDLKKGNFDNEVLAKRYWVSKSAMSWRIQDPHVLKYI